MLKAFLEVIRSTQVEREGANRVTHPTFKEFERNDDPRTTMMITVQQVIIHQTHGIEWNVVKNAVALDNFARESLSLTVQFFGL
jgi:hypothetical protein